MLHNVTEGNRATQICFVLVLTMFISQFLPLVLSRLTIGSLLEKVNIKQTSQESLDASKRLRYNHQAPQVKKIK